MHVCMHFSIMQAILLNFFITCKSFFFRYNWKIRIFLINICAYFTCIVWRAHLFDCKQNCLNVHWNCVLLKNNWLSPKGRLFCMTVEFYYRQMRNGKSHIISVVLTETDLMLLNFITDPFTPSGLFIHNRPYVYIYAKIRCFGLSIPIG